ncbi:MAG: hypothetical protein KBC73_01390 [Burkholderiaceae bacterium]|nr:hypothetical protein [Burkholderiaceae bacterium]
MNARLGWALALLAHVLGWMFFGWQGVLLALSGTVFWLLMQFSRALRAMRAAGSAPVGHVASAVMLHSRLKAGMRLMDLVTMTGSLGEKLADEPETYRWRDASGSAVEVALQRGRVSAWTLTRPDDADAPQ